MLEVLEALLSGLLRHGPWPLARHAVLVHHHLLLLGLLLLDLSLSLRLLVDRLLQASLVLMPSF
jgi:hypothetical protein